MAYRFVLLTMLMWLAGPLAAQPTPTRVQMETTEGSIVIEVDEARAPITAANFLSYVDRQLYDAQVSTGRCRAAPIEGSSRPVSTTIAD